MTSAFHLLSADSSYILTWIKNKKCKFCFTVNINDWTLYLLYNLYTTTQKPNLSPVVFLSKIIPLVWRALSVLFSGRIKKYSWLSFSASDLITALDVLGHNCIPRHLCWSYQGFIISHFWASASISAFSTKENVLL